MFKRIKSFLGFDVAATSNTGARGTGTSSKLSEIPAPKVKKGLQGVPSYLDTAKPDKSTSLTLNDRRLSQVDLSRVSRTQSTREIVREFSQSSPDLSSARFNYLRTAITNGYIATARNLDGTINPDATALVQQLLTRFDRLPDYQNGFSGTLSMRSISESLAAEIYMYGSCAAELVIGPDNLPQRIQPLSVTNIEFKPDDDGFSPVQIVGGDEIDLDIPTFFYVALDQDLLEAYSESMVQSAVQPVLFGEQFISDVRRVLRKAINPRLMVSINEESFRKYMPIEVQNDEQKATEYYNRIVSELETTLNELEPDEALIHTDTIEVSMENNGNISLSQEYSTIQGIANAKLATGAKILPSLLGHGNGSSNVASTETLVFMKSAEGAIQYKLNEIFSRILTLAVRLFGLDVTVEFKYKPISLRPESELEAFYQLEQSRVLQQLSLGMISDEEACLQLTGHLPPSTYVPLSGTRFYEGQQTQASEINPYNGESNDGSTLNQNLKSDQPKSGRGMNNTRNNNNIKRKQNGEA